MKRRPFIHDPSVLLEQGKAILAGNPEAKYAFRVVMVNLCLAGTSTGKLAKLSGCSRRALTLWVKKVDESGWDSLRTVPRTGRPPKLSPEQLGQLKEDVAGPPEKWGFTVWDGPSLAVHIRRKYDVEYKVRACQNLLHKMGFSLVRPRMFPALGASDEDAQDEFKKK
jgi:transposase